MLTHDQALFDNAKPGPPTRHSWKMPRYKEGGPAANHRAAFPD
jgi:hypothetical protein